LLDRDHAIAAHGENRAGHHFDGIVGAIQLERRRARGLGRLDAKAPVAAPQGLAIDRDPVHGDAIERRLVALRIDIFPQRPTDTLRQRQ
jgi:hypothetical protein